jgi:hypothetical protein
VEDVVLLDAPRSVSLTRFENGRVLIAGAFLVPYGAGNYGGATFRGPGQPATMTEHREGHASTLLPDGRVLLTGGRSLSGELLASAEFWAPADGAFHPTTDLERPAADHTAVLLSDGRVLIVVDGSGPGGLADPFVYEPEPIR